MPRTVACACVVLAAALAGCGGADSGPVKPQDDPEVLRKAEEAHKQAGQQEGGSQPVKPARKK